MKLKQLASGIAISVLASVSVNAFAADEQEELDVIMSVVEEDETPDQVIRRIELPLPVQRQPVVPDTTVPAEELEAVRNAVNELLLDSDSALSNAVNDAIASGDLDSLPDIIKENLPDDLVEDLTGDIDDLTDELTDELIDDLPLNLP